MRTTYKVLGGYRFLAVIGVAQALLGLPGGALAEPDQATKDRCAAYAKHAVEQYQLMKSTPGCDAHLDALSWRDDFGYHYNGCIVFGNAATTLSNQAREGHLRACGASSDAAPATADTTPAAAPDTTASGSTASPVATTPPTMPSVVTVGGPFAAPSGVGAPGRIFISKASYGANIDPVRAAYQAVYSDVAGQCNGKADCVYVIDWHRIGDPFLGSQKDYEVLYSCGAGVKRAYAPPEAGFGSRIELSCPRTASVITAKPTAAPARNANTKPKVNDTAQSNAAK